VANASSVVPEYTCEPVFGGRELSVAVTVKVYGPAGSASVPAIVTPAGSRVRPGGKAPALMLQE
jgi:hypothetical protein